MIESIRLRICGFIVAAMLIGYGLFSEDGIYYRYATPPVQTVAKSHTNPATTPDAPVYELTKTRIADIKVGTRVPAFDPGLGSEVREEFAEPNWAQWVKLNLEMIKSDGSLLKMEMLRSEDWVFENIDYQVPDEVTANASATLTPVSTFLMSLPVEPIRIPLRPLFAQLQDVRQLLHELEVDSVVVTLHLDLPEIGVRGLATVTGVEPCPAILPGPGKVVLTTFHHASSNLIDLYVSSQPPTGQASNSKFNANANTTTFGTVSTSVSTQSSAEALLFPTASRSEVIDQAWERIGVTGNHPIWSADRHDYVAAMDLRIGERLKNLSGDTVWVQQKLPRPGPTPVYNLEVQDEHVYYVGTNGVLAHNAGDNYQKGSKPKYSPDLDKWINKKGGTAWSELDGTWVYKDADGNIVRYPDDHPDFEGAGLVRQSTDIDTVPNRTTDFTNADASAPLGPRLPTNTWHHHQNMTTMQEIDSIIHRRFTHEGGYSRKKRGRE